MSPVLESGGMRRALDLPPTEGSRRYTSVSIDSRTTRPGALFVALPGETHHGFDFLEEAAARGARGALVPADRRLPDLDLEWFAVEDTGRALGELAAAVRRETDARVVGITGTSGKTTVKEMAVRALGRSFRVHATPGNLNSTVGLPLTILRAPGDADLWLLELGTSRRGEIGLLTEIAAPRDAVVTTVGPAHLEGLGDEEDVLEEKLDLVRGADPQGLVVVGSRPPELPRSAARLRPDVVVAGLDSRADFRPKSHEVSAEEVAFRRDGVEYRIPAGGRHHLADALLAAALAEGLGVPPREAAAGLAEFRPLGMRSALRRLGDLRVVVDCYNANPESFEAAVRYCEEAFPGRRLAAAVGSMLELGERSASEHRRMAARLAKAGFSPVAAVGEFVPAFRSLEGEVNGLRVLPAENAGEAALRLVEELSGDEVVLVKASRSMELERVVERLEREFGDGEGG